MTKINFIDVGAGGGYDAPWAAHTDVIDYGLCFEPNDDPVFEDKYVKYNAAVWDYDGEGTLYISGREGHGSSLLHQNFDWVRENFEKIKHEGDPSLNNTWFERSQITSSVPVPVKKLDTVLSDIKPRLPEGARFHFLKSDTQSGEGFVLHGAEQFLRNDCVGLELELFRYPLYEGVIVENDVRNMLSELGFEQIGWSGYMFSFNAAADFLFVRKDPRNDEEKAMIELIRHVYNPSRKEGLIKQRTFRQKVRHRVGNIVRGN